jgi:hypothetical protein
MSHFTELLIDTHHLLLIEAKILYGVVRKCASDSSSESLYTAGSIKVVADRMVAQAAAIQKRMKSLGHHNCWTEFGDEVEVELP